jgi:hypothetical protein
MRMCLVCKKWGGMVLGSGGRGGRLGLLAATALCVAVMTAALALTLMASYRPRWIPGLAAGAGVAGVLLVALG